MIRSALDFTSPTAFWSSLSTAALLAVAAMTIVGCAAPPPAVVSAQAVPFDRAVEQATDALVQQTQTRTGWLAKVDARLNKRPIVLDPTLDAASGQQTTATQKLDGAIVGRIASNFEQIEVLPFRAANLSRAQYLLTGTLSRESAAYRLNLSLIDLKSGVSVAQSSALSSPEGVDMSPLAYYRDSPVLVKDKVVDGYVRTSTTPAGQKADATYLERIAAATVINDATLHYNAGRYPEALGEYRSAMATPAGDQMRVLNGIYLSNVKMGQMAEAEQAFGRVVASGIAYNQLGVKLLFNPGGTDFWSDPQVSNVYGMWLRQIARESASAKVCLDIVGHTSKTGSEAFNDALSLKRATFVRQRLGAEAGDIASRSRVQGVGFRQNIVGSGTDDGVDALDRRVEFKIVQCGGGGAAASAPVVAEPRT